MNTTKKLIAGVKNPVRYVDMQCPPPIIDKKDDDAGSVGMKSLLLLPGAKSDDDIVAFLSSRGELSYYTRKNGILVSTAVCMYVTERAIYNARLTLVLVLVTDDRSIL